MTPSIHNNSLPDVTQSWHTLELQTTITTLQTDAEKGLSTEQIQQRQQHYGLNELEEGAKRSNMQIFVDQFTNIMLIMLIVVALISGIIEIVELQAGSGSGGFPFKDTIAILTIVILNGILGYLQEVKAEEALAALKKLSSPRVRVIRDGRQQEIDGKNLVPGDIMLLEAGVQVPADGRLIEESNLQIRESALTGESHAVSKQVELTLKEDASLGDRINLVFQGTEVGQGRAKVAVTRTGMQTELGKIASMLQSVESEPTPLQQRMTQLGNVLVSGSLTLVGIVIIGGLIYAVIQKGFNLPILGNVFKDLTEISLSMAVAVVPEGLPAVITVTLALGTQRMVQRKALIRKLPAVETLGSVTHICSDKTGTLTQNKMVVQRVETPSNTVKVTGEGYEPNGDFYLTSSDTKISAQDDQELQQLMLGCVLCNDAVLQYDNNQWIILGDPTEGALVVLAGKGGVDKEPLQKQIPRVKEIPFSSERKRMSVICDQGESSYLMFTKGSPELILERCTKIQITDTNQPITEAQRTQILEQNNDMASKGLRVLGFAYRELREIPPSGTEENTEKELIWLGLVGMLDAPRPEVREAVRKCKEAGIRPMMITGDHPLTAKAIAYDLGIAQDGDRVLTGQELERMSQEDLEQQVDLVSIYARVAPEHKLRIVQALQKRGRLVAMTGDGVNDAPALKQADIGIAMGITGTDVSKEASDMILLDDNFATIVAATEEGRIVYTNIRRFIKYILSSNIGEVITIMVSPLLFASTDGSVIGQIPLIPLQILWMNLVTDGLPALALAVEPGEPNVMKRPPFNPKESIFARGLGSYMVRIGIVFAIITIAMMFWAYNYTHTPGFIGDPNEWKTMVFTSLCLAQMGQAMASRSESQLIIELNPLGNPFLLGAVVVTTLLQLALIYVPPLQAFFGTHFLTPTELLVCLGFSSLSLVWIEMEKLFFRFYFKGKS